MSPALTLADWGLLVGIAVGLFGAAIQFMSWLDRRDTKRKEDELREAERRYMQARENRERIEHEAILAGRIPDRRA